ncbi:uncharacterized protein LOC111060408 isoform X3 [Nilaparvata lugens]|uniref:uncharacterized protein LOC111060408 isoform X3 n=1 Tax=Nilaparvata lugens TaxID=108931 RepID=UPI000B995EEB|nr:uncharacterized protein LOC111060408 isoform X3 [Nilaparvata lugens]
MSSFINDASYFRTRLRQLEEMYPEPTTFGDCDVASYFYLLLSAGLTICGSFITVVALGMNEHVSLHLGHMWLVGPVFICSGMMMGIRTVLYLRRKSVIQMLLRQRALLRGLQLEIAQAHSVASLSNSQSYVVRNASTLTLPPAYDILMTAASAPASGPAEAPPPTYEEAMFLIDDHKLKAIIVEQTEAAAAASNSSEEARTKESD